MDGNSNGCNLNGCAADTIHVYLTGGIIMHYAIPMIFSRWMTCMTIGLMTIGCTTDIDIKHNSQNAGTSRKGDFMTFSRKPPDSWFWSHDIQPHHLDDLPFPGSRLMRISAYSALSGEKGRRFAAIIFQETGTDSSVVHDIPLAELEARMTSSGERPVSITAEDVTGQPYFSLVLHQEPGPDVKISTDLDAAGLSQLSNDQRRIADFTSYVVNGVRKYAAIVEERSGPSLVFTRVTAKELEAQLRKHNVTPVRIRGFSEGNERFFTAVAERFDAGSWNWYDHIDADTVADKLEAHNAYPFDLEAYRTEQGIRYTVIMYRDRK